MVGKTAKTLSLKTAGILVIVTLIFGVGTRLSVLTSHRKRGSLSR